MHYFSSKFSLRQWVAMYFDSYDRVWYYYGGRGRLVRDWKHALVMNYRRASAVAGHYARKGVRTRVKYQSLPEIRNRYR